jgi:hypothetical protein
VASRSLSTELINLQPGFFPDILKPLRLPETGKVDFLNPLVGEIIRSNNPTICYGCWHYGDPAEQERVPLPMVRSKREFTRTRPAIISR